MPNTSMLLRRIFSTTAAAAAFSLLPGFAQAQLITNVDQATAARDSVLLQANKYRQLIEQRAAGFDVKVFRLGKRRRVVKGYYAKKKFSDPDILVSSHDRAWKHVTRTLRSGTVRERYMGYLEGHKVLEESRTNGRANYVFLSRLVRYKNQNNGPVMGRAPLGQLTREGYVRWGRTQYVLTAPSTL